MACAYENISKMYEDAGKSLLPSCEKCGNYMTAEIRQNGHTWKCSKCEFTFFEMIKK